MSLTVMNFRKNIKNLLLSGYGYRVASSGDELPEFISLASDSNGFNDELYFPHKSIVGTTERYFLASPTYRSIEKELVCKDSWHAECVVGDSKILTSLDGNTIEAQSLSEGNDIIYYDMLSQTNKIGKVKKVYLHKNAENFVKYTFDDDTYIEVTDYHPIYTKNGWKSLTNMNGYPSPEIGDEVKTFNNYKKIVNIEEYINLQDCYDFEVETIDNQVIEDNNYYANDTLVQGISYKSISLPVSKQFSVMASTHEHQYTDFAMDCLVSCTYEGKIEKARLDEDTANATIRPIVVLPTTAFGYQDENGMWYLEKIPGRLVVHHYLEGTTDEIVKIADDQITENLKDGFHYKTSPLAAEDYDTDKYEYTGKSTGDAVEGEIVSNQTTEVTYWYKLKKHIITTKVDGTGGTITGEELDVVEEVPHGENSIKDIIATPNEGYRIESITINGNEIQFTTNADGSTTLDKFINMIEDKHIVVKFMKKTAEDVQIITHHLEDETNKKLDDDVVDVKKIGDDYTTIPSNNVLQTYEFVRKTDNWQGKIEDTTPIEVTYWYKLKKHIITTEVDGIGGTITGEELDVVEEVPHGNDSVKDIVVTPSEGYRILKITVNGNEIEFVPNKDGTLVLDKFKNMTEDKHIVVKFIKVDTSEAMVITHHKEYVTNKQLDEDVIEVKKIGDTYETKASDTVLINYEFVNKTANWKGTIANSQTIEVTYWYQSKKHKITTEVDGVGGTITGENEDVVEEVPHGENSVKDIVIKPDTNYRIFDVTVNGKKIIFKENTDGTAVLDKFINMTEDKHIVVRFVKKDDSLFNGIIPQTGGENVLLMAGLFIALIGGLSFIKYRKYKD